MLTLRVQGPDALAVALAAVLSVSGCATTAPNGTKADPSTGSAAGLPAPAQLGPRETLESFVVAARGGDFQSAYRLLAAPWRARYTPERLAQDFSAAQAAAREKLERAAVASEGSPAIDGERASFPIGADKSVRLVREAQGWRIESLE